LAKLSYVLLAAFFLAAFLFYPYITDSKDSERPMREITALTTLPPALSNVISAEYEKKYKVRVNFAAIPEGGVNASLTQTNLNPALVIADKETLINDKNSFKPYISTYWDAAPEAMKDKDALWTGVWFDPIVFCVNSDYLRANKTVPLSWQNLAKAKVRIGMTDFVAASAQANLMFSMIAQYGDAAAYQILRGIHPNVTQYAKFLNNPVRQAGMGEADIAIAVESEAIRYMNDDYPLKIIYPRDGTAYMLIGTGIIKNLTAEEDTDAKKFADWLQTDEAHQILQKNGFYFIPTNPETLTYKSFAGKDMLLYTMDANFTKQQKHDFLDRWVKYIRLGGR